VRLLFCIGTCRKLNKRYYVFKNYLVGSRPMMPDLIMGVFAFMIAGVSLFRVMAKTEFYRLTMMKRVFGRKRGLTIHFVVSVALPITLGIVFLTGGVTGKTFAQPLQASDLPVIKFDNTKAIEFEEDWLLYPDAVV
jgi:hypothetical protein